MLSFLQSVTALIGLDKLSGASARGKTLACAGLSRVEQAPHASGTARLGNGITEGKRGGRRFAARAVVCGRVRFGGAIARVS
jgi:hypothetical protein